MGPAPTITLHVFGSLRPYCAGAAELSISARTVRGALDDLVPALYFGTTTGQLWIGREGGEKWECLFDSLPPIHNVKVAVV